MATLDKLLKEGALLPIHVQLDGNEVPHRTLIGTPDFVTWCDTVLPTIPMDQMYDEFPPALQVDARFYEFVIGEHFDDKSKFKKLSRSPDYYICEIRTTEIRIFGWFYKKDIYICAFGDTATKIHKFHLHERYMAQTIFVRDRLNLDDPKYLASGVYEDVLSDAY